MNSKTKKMGVSLTEIVTDAQLERLLFAGRNREAEQLARRMLKNNPVHIRALRICAEQALLGGKYSEAIERYELLVSKLPNDADALMNLGLAQIGLNVWDEALASLLKAYQISPQNPDVCGNLSSMYFHLGEYGRSLDFADRAVDGNPQNYSAHNSRGAALLKLQRYEEALLALAKAIELYPGEYYADAVENLGLTLHDMGRYEDAYECYTEICRISQNGAESLGLMLHSALQICRWDNLRTSLHQLVASVRNNPSVVMLPPFMFLSLPKFGRHDHRVIAENASRTMLAVKLPEPPFPNESYGLPQGRLRIGYLSADFHDHATAHLITEVLELHDRSKFEVFGYSYGPDDGSSARRRILQSFEHFRELREVSRNDAAEIIRSDAVDILVDLKGWTYGARLDISAMRPAPVIVNWLGYPGTMGHAALADYIIGDPVVTPLGHAADYSETIIQLPDVYQPNDRKRLVSSPPTRAAMGLPDEGVVYCSFNQAYKITPDVFSAWCDILRAVPGSVLWLLQPSDATMANLRREAQANGIDPARLVFAARCALPDHLGRLQLASLALDTSPYGSHTTCSDALWAGVPLLTFLGETFASRVAASLLFAAGIPELIENNLQDYVVRAIQLGNNPSELEVLQSRLHRERDTCALFDAPRFTRNLESAYERVVADSRAGVRRPIVVEREIARG